MIQTVKLAVIYATAMMVIGIILFETIPQVFLGFFNASPQMLAIGVPALRIIAIHFIFAGFSIVCSALFQEVGKGTYSLLVSAIRQLFVLLPVAYFLSQLGNINYVWFAFPIAELFSATISAILLRKINKQLDF